MSVLARRRAIMGSIVQPKRSCLGAATGTAESPHRWGKYHTYPTAKNPSTTQPLTLTLTHQPPHDSPATLQHTHACTVTDSVGHSTCMSVLARRRAIMGSIVQPKRSCLGASTGTAESPHRWGKYHTYTTAKNSTTTQPLTLTLTYQPPHDSPTALHTKNPHATTQPKRSCLGAATGTRWGKYHTYPTANPNSRYGYFTHMIALGVFSYLPHSPSMYCLNRLGWSQYMHECVGASQGYHGVYRAAQTVLSRCCHGYSGIPTPVGQIPYLPHRQEPTNHPTANPNPNSRYGYFTHPWDILLFTPPPRSRV